MGNLTFIGTADMPAARPSATVFRTALATVLAALFAHGALLPGIAAAQGATAPLASAAQGLISIKTSDGVALAVDVAGQGLPCLYLHGGPGNGSESIARLAGPMLQQHFKMIYLDQRGSGRSASDPNKNYTMERMIQDLEDVRERLQIKQWVVMSHSFGGTIAAAYARKHPGRVQGLVLVNSILNLPASMESTVSYGYSLLPAATRPPMDPAAPLPQRFGMVMGMLGQAKLSGKLMYRDDASEARVQAAMKGLATNQDMAATLFQTSAISGYLEDFAPSTAALRMPVLVVTGSEDHVSGVELYKAFRFPNQSVLTVPGKHNALIENQAEVSKALAGFSASLSAQPGATPLR